MISIGTARQFETSLALSRCTDDTAPATGTALYVVPWALDNWEAMVHWQGTSQAAIQYSQESLIIITFRSKTKKAFIFVIGPFHCMAFWKVLSKASTSHNWWRHNWEQFAIGMRRALSDRRSSRREKGKGRSLIMRCTCCCPSLLERDIPSVIYRAHVHENRYA